MKSRIVAAFVYDRSSPAKATFRWFNSDAVVHCVLQSLSAPEILFRRLYAQMAKQKLDLFQLTARNVTETGACSGGDHEAPA